MNVKKFFKLLLTDTSVYFTALTAIYAVMMLIINVGEDEVLFRADTVCFLFLFALLAAGARSILRIQSMHAAVRVLCHYLILVLSFYLCLLLPTGMRAPQVLIGLVLFSVLYAVAALIIVLCLSRFRKHTEKTAAYEKQFPKKR